MNGPAVCVPEPAAPLQQVHLFELLQAHRKGALHLVQIRQLAEWTDTIDCAVEPYALNEDPAALVTALLRLSQEALLIHALATADPGRPVAEVLTQAVRQLKWS